MSLLPINMFTVSFAANIAANPAPILFAGASLVPARISATISTGILEEYEGMTGQNLSRGISLPLNWVKQIGEPFRYPPLSTDALFVPKHCDFRQAYKEYLERTVGDL